MVGPKEVAAGAINGSELAMMLAGALCCLPHAKRNIPYLQLTLLPSPKGYNLTTVLTLTFFSIFLYIPYPTVHIYNIKTNNNIQTTTTKNKQTNCATKTPYLL